MFLLCSTRFVPVHSERPEMTVALLRNLLMDALRPLPLP